jgi:hypothetical protein
VGERFLTEGEDDFTARNRQKTRGEGDPTDPARQETHAERRSSGKDGLISKGVGEKTDADDERFDFETSGGSLTCHNTGIAGHFPSINNPMERYCQRLIGRVAPATMAAFDSGPHLELKASCGILPEPDQNPPEMLMRIDGPAEQFWYPSNGDSVVS